MPTPTPQQSHPHNSTPTSVSSRSTNNPHSSYSNHPNHTMTGYNTSTATYTQPDYSYFSPHAPSSASASPMLGAVSPGGFGKDMTGGAMSGGSVNGITGVRGENGASISAVGSVTAIRRSHSYSNPHSSSSTAVPPPPPALSSSSQSRPSLLSLTTLPQGGPTILASVTSKKANAFRVGGLLAAVSASNPPSCSHQQSYPPSYSQPSQSSQPSQPSQSSYQSSYQSSSSSSSYSQPQQPHAYTSNDDVLHEFRLHIPAPPNLTLPGGGRRGGSAVYGVDLGARMGTGTGSGSGKGARSPLSPTGSTSSLSSTMTPTGTLMMKAPSGLMRSQSLSVKGKSTSCTSTTSTGSPSTGLPSGSTSTSTGLTSTSGSTGFTSTDSTTSHPQHQMQTTTQPYKYTFTVILPHQMSAEMVTISANKGEKLRVIADEWDCEDGDHYEWLISFSPHDVDMASVHARFEGGRLTIEVGRRRRVW